MMECPDCGSKTPEVVYTKKSGCSVMRYRVCKDCGLRFRTEETVWKRLDTNGFRDGLDKIEQSINQHYSHSGIEITLKVCKQKVDKK